MMLVTTGKKIGNEPMGLIFDREHFANEGQNRCLTPMEIEVLQKHFSGEVLMTADALVSVIPHLNSCALCAHDLESVGSIRSAGLKMVLQQESLHTSLPPNRTDTILRPKMRINLNDKKF